MSDKIIDRKLKAELDLIKIYAVFLFGLIPGNINLLYRYSNGTDVMTLLFFISGIILFIFILITFLKSYFTINKLTKFKNHD